MDRIQLRRDSSARWAEINPILLEGEIGFETDTKFRKIGDGVHRWNELEYLKAENILQETGNNESATMSQAAITRELNGLGSHYEPKWEAGKLLDGRIVLEGDYYHCVLPIDYGKDIEVSGLRHSTTQYIDAINFFDKDMVFIGKNSTTNGTISKDDIPENAAFIGVTKGGLSTTAAVEGGVLIYPKNIAEVAAKHEHRIMEAEKRLEEIGSGVCKFDNLLLDYNFNISSNQKGSSATYTRKDEYLEVSVENSNSRFFTPNAEYFSGKQGDYVLVILETFGEFSSTFSVMGTKAGAMTYAGKYATSFNVNQSIDNRTYIGIINYKNWGGDDLGIGMQTGSLSGTSVFRFKRMCAINLGGDNDNRYKAYQKLGNQFFIELAHSTGFNPSRIFSDKNINYTWNGKKMVSIGDSTVASCNWQPIVAERLGLNWSKDETLYGIGGHKPMGVGGSMIAPYVGGAQGTKSGDSIYMRADDVKHYKPDVIFLLGGINDSWQSVNGSISDAPYTGSEFTSYPEMVSIYSYYKGVVLKLISQNPLAKLVCVCPAMPWARNSGIEGQRIQKNRLDDVYSKVIKEVAEYYGCLFVDTNKKWNINEYNIAVLNDDGLTYGESRYYRADSTNSCPHPNEAGARMWADVICMEIN